MNRDPRPSGHRAAGDRAAPGTLLVSEIFGPTIQGEGPSCGRPCAFLRLGECNLSCRWCDTPYTWDWTGKSNDGRSYSPRDELRPMDAADIAAQLLEFSVPLIVVSGGEPLRQQRRLLPLVERLRASGREVEIETNGTIGPLADLTATGVRYNVSPKLAHSGDPLKRRIRPQALKLFAVSGQAVFKFVLRDAGDADEVAGIADAHQLSPVWIMPQGRTSDEVIAGLRELGELAAGRGWNVTARLHVLIWEDKRGV